MFRPEVNTTPFGALLLLAGAVLVVLGAMVLPGLIYIAAWALVLVVAIVIAFYIGRRFHRWALGKSGGAR